MSKTNLQIFQGKKKKDCVYTFIHTFMYDGKDQTNLLKANKSELGVSFFQLIRECEILERSGWGKSVRQWASDFPTHLDSCSRLLPATTLTL